MVGRPLCISVCQRGAVASGEVAFPPSQHEGVQAAPGDTKPQGCPGSGSPLQEGTSLAFTPSLGRHAPGSAKAVSVLWCEVLSLWDGTTRGG